MDFFRSVFSEDPPSSPPPSSSDNYNSEPAPTSVSNSQSQNPDPDPDPNPKPQFPSIASGSWATFGSSLLKSVASKSESVIGSYSRELEEFSSGLIKETAVIREAASRAVKDLPARLESGAAVAQNSLESVGQVIDNIGGAVSEIIVHGKDSIFNPIDGDNGDASSDVELVETGENDGIHKQNLKPYSRLDALIRALQCDIKTYCDEPEEVEEYEEWKKGFSIDEKIGEIEDLVEENGAIVEIYEEVVPGKIDRETFWSRYFYRVYRVKKAEEARLKLVKRAIEGEDEEDLSWDVDDDEEEEDGMLKKDIEETEKEMASLRIATKEMGGLSSEDKKRSSPPRMKSEAGYDDKDSIEGRIEDGKSDMGSSGGRNDISDFSVVSSQRSSHEEEDIAWDEIEDIGSDNEPKVAARGGPNIADLRKQLTAAEKEELPWDAEDDDQEPKS